MVILAVLVSGCAGRVRAPLAGGTGNGATFTYAYNLQVMTEWDPAVSYSNEVIAMNNMYEQLTRYNSTTGKVEPLLAASWSKSADGLTWTFNLRHHATFHTGRPVTAAAAKAALDRTIKLGEGAAYEWGAVKSIAAPDTYTLVFHLSYPSPLDLISTAAYGAYIYDTQAAGSGDLAAWFEKGNEAGSGPYSLAQWNKGEETELRLNSFPPYWGGWSGAHYQHLVFQVVPEPTTAAQLLQAGEVTFVNQLPPSLWQQVGTYENVRTSEQASFQNEVSMFNTASGPLVDVRLRRAVMLALDYQGLNRALFGSATLSSGFVPPGLLGYQAGLGPVQDLPQARELLAQAGYGPGGKKLTLTLTTTEGDSALGLLATVWQADLAQIGVDVQIQSLAWESQWDKAKSTDQAARQDIMLLYWFPDYADPFSWFINLFHSEKTPNFGLSYFSNPAVDKTIDGLQLLTVTDRPAAQKTYVQLQQTLLNDGVAVSAFTTRFQRAYLSTVSGYVDNPSYANVVFVYTLRPVVAA